MTEPVPLTGRSYQSFKRKELSDLPRYATHLKHDHSSPDLASVLRDLRRERSARSRRERVRALISTLEREWTRLYARNLTAEAVFSDYTWQRAGTISAAWIASAKDEPWLRSEAGRQIASRFATVRTKGTAAIYGNDRVRFAKDLEESDATSPVIRALGIGTDPKVSELIAQLTEMRARRDIPSNHDLDLRYAAIAANCKHHNPSPDNSVGRPHREAVTSPLRHPTKGKRGSSTVGDAGCRPPGCISARRSFVSVARSFPKMRQLRCGTR